MTAPANTAATDALVFAEKLLALLDEGRFTATYKYAVLLALMDLCLEQTSDSGAAPHVVTTTQLAEKVVALYWPHTAPFPAPAAPVLRQNTTGQAEIVTAVRRFRERTLPDPNTPLALARARSPDAFARLVRKVEWKLVEMPLPRVQQLGNIEDRFIYEIAWTADIRRADFDDATGFDNRIHLFGGAGEHLVRLSALLRPLIQRQWAAMVAQINSGIIEDARLEELTCIDHFLPWSRHPDDGIDNLVATDTRCNGSKSDFLASAEHVGRWMARSRTSASDLATIATQLRWDRHAASTHSVARAIYLRLRPEVRLWRLGREFVPADRARLAEILGAEA